MKNKLSQILFSFITGATLSNSGINTHELLSTHQTMLIDQAPSAHVKKLNPDQVKEILELRLKGFDAYVVTIVNPSQRTYSLSIGSIDAPILSHLEAKNVLAKGGYSMGVALGSSVAGHFFAPIGFAGTIFNFALMKKAKIYEGKLEAMLLEKEIINSYAQLSRVILVKSGQDLKEASIEVIDLKTMNPKKLNVVG
jgi:hypothetical protein